MNELFEKWISEHDVANPKSLKNIKYVWVYCEQIYNVEVQSIRARHIIALFSNPYKTTNDAPVLAKPATAQLLKSTMNQLCDYAMHQDLMLKNYAREVMMPSDHEEKHHKSFTQEEMDSLWGHVDDNYVAMVIFQCYMGWRPSEMLSIKRENVNLEKMFIIGGSKTKAGMNRTVPIHSKIRDIFQDFGILPLAANGCSQVSLSMVVI